VSIKKEKAEKGGGRLLCWEEFFPLGPISDQDEGGEEAAMHRKRKLTKKKELKENARA